MLKKKRVILGLGIAMSALFAFALAGCGEEKGAPEEVVQDGVKYLYQEKTDSYTAGAFADDKSTITEITVPATIKGKPVTSVRTRSFQECSKLETVTIEAADVGERAFYSLGRLKSVTIGEGVKRIARNAFSSCTALETIAVSDSVTNIEDGAFSGDIKLQSISTAATIGDNAFSGCVNLQSAQIKEGAKQIGAKAFEKCARLSTLKLPSTLANIGKEAFNECRALEEVEFPTEQKLTLGDYAFQYTSLKEIKVPANVKPGLYTFGKIRWSEDTESTCTGAWFYETEPTKESLGLNSVGYTWDSAAFRVYVPKGTLEKYKEVCRQILNEDGDDAWVRCVVNVSPCKLVEFDPAEKPYKA